MNEKIKIPLKLRDYRYDTGNAKISVRMPEGVLVIQNLRDKPTVVKKNNFNNYGLISGILFFMLVVIVDKEEIIKNGLYIIFIILFACNYLHNRVILEINRHKIYDMIERVAGDEDNNC